MCLWSDPNPFPIPLKYTIPLCFWNFLSILVRAVCKPVPQDPYPIILIGEVRELFPTEKVITSKYHEAHIYPQVTRLRAMEADGGCVWNGVWHRPVRLHIWCQPGGTGQMWVETVVGEAKLNLALCIENGGQSL